MQVRRPEKRDLRVVHGEETRKRILGSAMDVASTEGLEALTIGRLATELGMSKAGLFSHFGSKEALQIATLDAAREVFLASVVAPAFQSAEPGLPRLRALADNWLRYIEDKVFRGGCVFSSAAVEFDSRPGPVRDRVAAIVREWVGALEHVIGEARELGQLAPDVDPGQLAFELNALMLGANWGFQLLECATPLERARRGIDERLSRAAAGHRAPDALETPHGGEDARRHRKRAR
ncbi:MAG: TetR/AcrR family transcriptional regulator [Polyangiaceae bacterium]